MAKDYSSHSDRKLIVEYGYFKPAGPHSSTRENIEEMADADVEELFAIADEMKRRVDPGERTDTRAV